MQLVELILHGVVGFPPRLRLPLGSGHVVVRGDAPLLPVLESVLCAEGPDDGAARLAAAPGARAAAVVRGKGGTYRLVRELQGGLIVQHLDEEARRFVQVEASPGEIGPFLRTQLGVPTRGVLRELLTFTPRAPALPDLAPIPSLVHAVAAPPASAPDAAAIARLERELEAAGKADALQARLDEIFEEQAALQREGDAVSRVESRARAAREELAGFDALGDLPDDVGPLVSAWDAAGADRDAALQRIESDRGAFDELLRAGAPRPLWRDPRFVGACTTGVAALGVGLFTHLRIVALLNVPAFGVAAALGVRWVGQLQARDAATRMAAVFAERARKVEAQWEAATAGFRDAMARAGAQSPAQLAERVQGRARAREQVQALEDELARLKRSRAGADARLEALRAEADALERQIATLAAGAYRPRATVEAELAALRAPAAAQAPPLALAAAVPGMLLLETDPLPAPAAGEPDAATRMLEHAAELLAVDRHEIGGRLGPRVGQYLAALTDRPAPDVELSSTSGLRCGGARWTDLPEGDRALALLSLHLALVEQVTAVRRLPVIYDDPFGFLGEAQRQRIVRVLHGLGKRTQVIHRTRLESMVQGADAVAEVA